MKIGRFLSSKYTNHTLFSKSNHSEKNTYIILITSQLNSLLYTYLYNRYGLIDPSYRNPEHGMPYPCRGMFILDPNKIVRMISFHPWSMGRSTKEIIRTIDSLQLTQKFEHKVYTQNFDN